MIDSLALFQVLSKSLGEETARFLSETLTQMYQELSGQVTKEEFTKAQDRTDKALQALTEAQKRTEVKVAELAEAQKRTEVKVAELAEAQRETERRLQRLEVRFDAMIAEFADTTRQLGGLSDSVGYGLENSVFPYLRSFARRELGIELSRYDRRNIEYPDGRFDEINIYGEGTRGGQAVVLLGEAKSQPSKRDIDAFAARMTRVEAHLKQPVVGFLVGHTFAPEVQRYLASSHPEITPVHSYRFEVSYAREVPPTD